ncbi:MAG: YrdB family protein [Thermomicrobiales bacterium]
MSAPPHREKPPLNLSRRDWVLGAIRFALEIWAAVALGWWGWHLAGGGAVGIVLAIAIPTAAFAVWGIFAVKDDPSRNPNPPVPVPGWVRLLIEAAVFGLAAYGLWSSGHRAWAEGLLTAVGLLYFVSYERIAWLLKQH